MTSLTFFPKWKNTPKNQTKKKGSVHGWEWMGLGLDKFCLKKTNKSSEAELSEFGFSF